jgi:hypothetical protein
MTDLVKLEPSISSANFGRKSVFRAKHSEKAHKPILRREDAREISIDDKLVQPEKALSPITWTESGSESVDNDSQPQKALARISLRIEPSSNTKSTRFEQPLKHATSILVVAFGRVNDFSEIQHANARKPKISEEDRGRKTT